MATDCVTWVRHFLCGLQGHDNLLQFGQSRLSLKCTSCGHESPGWDIRPQRQIDLTAAAAAQPSAPRRRFVPQLAGARRLA